MIAVADVSMPGCIKPGECPSYELTFLHRTLTHLPIHLQGSML